MTSPAFKAVLRSIVVGVVPVACSSTLDPTPMPESVACFDESSTARYATATVSPAIDGIAVVSGTTSNGQTLANATRLADVGKPCARASDHAACLAKVDALLAKATPGWSIWDRNCGFCDVESSEAGVVTSGDDVQQIGSADQLVAALAPIDTTEEAAIVLRVRGYRADCDKPNASHDGDGWTFLQTNEYCSGSIVETQHHVSRDGTVTETARRERRSADNHCAEGRRPTTLEATPDGARWLTSLPACFAEIAHMEAAAVIAFDELAAALAHHGAPPEMLEAIARARQDEVEHARTTHRLARRFGGQPPLPRVRAPSRVPSLFELAKENAVEGCVREAWGALVAAFQAARATDLAVRAAFARIAEDEAAHAELSFRIEAWLDAKLTAEERAEIAAAKDAAWSELEGVATVEPARDVVRVAGMPTAREAKVLLARLRAEAPRAAA